MDTNVVNGILRAVVPAVLTWMAAKGYIQQAGIPDIAAALLAAISAVGAAIWSVKSNLPASK